MRGFRVQGPGPSEQEPAIQAAEQGFMLVGLIVAVALILLVLGIAAPKIAEEIRRDKEIEAAHRGQQYVRGVQLYYRKFGRYPGSMEQLEKTNNIRFLRQRYSDPVSGRDDWRVIPVGQNKTTVKGFFGQPLAGIAAAGVGSAAGTASSGLGAAAPASPPATTPAGSAPGTNGAPGTGAATGTDAASGAGPPAAGNTPGTGTPPGSGTAPGSGNATGIGSATASSFGPSSGTAFMGVGLNHTGDSLLDLNEQTTYETWEFLYDPRIEALKSKASLLGGAPVAAPGTNGTGQAPQSGTGGAPGTGGTPATGTGTTGGTGSPTGTTTTPPQQ